MSPDAAAVVVGLIVTADVALVLACRFVRREPFITLDRWLAAAWGTVYRWTGAAALDQRLNSWIDRRDADVFNGLVGALDDAGLQQIADRCRAAAARSLARAE